MSGGSYNYFYRDLDEIYIEGQDNPRRKALQEVIDLLKGAMHDVEWVDSSDYGKGDEYESIDKLMDYLGSKEEIYKRVLYKDLEEKVEQTKSIMSELLEKAEDK